MATDSKVRVLHDRPIDVRMQLFAEESTVKRDKGDTKNQYRDPEALFGWGLVVAYGIRRATRVKRRRREALVELERKMKEPLAELLLGVMAYTNLGEWIDGVDQGLSGQWQVGYS